MLRIIPLTLKEANALVRGYHRHHDKVQGCRWAIGAMKNEQLVGACIVGRCQARMVEQYLECSVTRLVTFGGKNECSFLYGAAARIAREMGYEKIRTEILENEPGTSLKAAGWTYSHTTKGGNYDRPSRKRSVGKYPEGPKQVWFKVLIENKIDVCGNCGSILEGKTCTICGSTVRRLAQPGAPTKEG
jgi:hypothetical protein